MSERRGLAARLLLMVTPLLMLAALDVGLWLAGVVPPASPAAERAGAFDSDFFPLVRNEPDGWRVRPEWVSRDDELRILERSDDGTVYLLPGFRPVNLAHPKPARTERVIVLGGSVAFGLYVGADEAFPGVLERLLASELPDRRMEVVNLASPGLDSERVANLLGSVDRLDPDLVVVLSGHNEMLAGPKDQDSDGLFLSIHRSLRSISVLYGWADHALRSTTADATEEDESAVRARARAVQIYSPAMVAASERQTLSRAERIRAAERYQSNLERMAAEARTSEVPLVFVLPEPNLLLPPVLGPDTESDEAARDVARRIRRIGRTIEDGRSAEALARLDTAIAASPRNPVFRYQKGIALLRTGRTEEAVEALESAVSLDVQTHRITERLQARLIAVAEETGVPLVDLRPRFRDGLSVERAKRLFLDHVHPTEKGHRVIAEEILPHALEVLGRGH